MDIGNAILNGLDKNTVNKLDDGRVRSSKRFAIPLIIITFDLKIVCSFGDDRTKIVYLSNFKIIICLLCVSDKGAVFLFGSMIMGLVCFSNIFKGLNADR